MTDTDEREDATASAPTGQLADDNRTDDPTSSSSSSGRCCWRRPARVPRLIAPR